MKFKVITAIALLSASFAANAAQILTANGDNTLSAVISRQEPTLIRIEGQPIRQIFGAKEEFTLQADKDTGEAYIRPTTEKQAISVFVSDHSGNTIKLMLAITNAPSETIVITGVKPRVDKGANPIAGRDVPHVQAIKRVVVALDSKDALGLDAQQVNQIIPLWNEARFVLRRKVDAGSLIGHKYTLTNLTAQPMVIDEREFYRRGVLGVSVERPTLPAGQTTNVYVVSESGHE